MIKRNEQFNSIDGIQRISISIAGDAAIDSDCACGACDCPTDCSDCSDCSDGDGGDGGDGGGGW